MLVFSSKKHVLTVFPKCLCLCFKEQVPKIVTQNLSSMPGRDTQELLEGLTAPDTGERRSAALDSFNSNLDLFIERIEQIVASATSS